MSFAATALAPVIQLCKPDGSSAECHRPLLRSSMTGRPAPAKFEPPKNQPVRPVTSTFVYWLWLLSGGTYLVASRRVQLCEVAGTGATTEVAARTAAAIRRGKISPPGLAMVVWAGLAVARLARYRLLR